jgi:hypothetical protein
VTKDQNRRIREAVEQYAHDMAQAVMESFAARVREEARLATGPHHLPVRSALLAVASSAEATAGGIREEAARRKSPPPVRMRPKILYACGTDNDGYPECQGDGSTCGPGDTCTETRDRDEGPTDGR